MAHQLPEIVKANVHEYSLPGLEKDDDLNRQKSEKPAEQRLLAPAGSLQSSHNGFKPGDRRVRSSGSLEANSFRAPSPMRLFQLLRQRYANGRQMFQHSSVLRSMQR
jgi:hypothetical protein